MKCPIVPSDQHNKPYFTISVMPTGCIKTLIFIEWLSTEILYAAGKGPQQHIELKNSNI